MTWEEKAKKQREINEAKAYLERTDYIVTKMAECIVQGDDNKLEALKQTYKVELTQRQEMRAKINELQK